ncbi:MAG: cation diffusion facilitator family transporter [Bacteroidales bacterium]|nr:cation diffusion facilitator family transporter [Bacteroidales bacterium]MDY6074171.1 cation diffusion facilitator family transporter [Bacteroidales bacterium]
MKENQREKEIYKVTIVGALANVILLIFKFVAGIISNSAAMIADAVHSLSDFITDVVVIVFVKISSKPQDKSHDYGHGKFETLATLIIGIALLFVGLMILYNGASATYRCIWLGEELHRPGMIAFWAAIFSIILKEAVYQYTVFKGKNLNSQAVIANAWHHRSDAFSSIGTAVGIGGAIFLGDKWVVLDPIAAIVVSVFIINVSLKIIIKSINELLEKSLPDEIENEIIKVAESFDMVKDVHDLRTRRIGNNIAIEMHLLMDGNLSLQCTHNTTELIESELRKKYGEHTHIAIHVEPF